MSVFALVRHRSDLPRACDEMSKFFSFCRGKAPGGLPEPMLGIWIDSNMVREVPTSLTVRQPSLDGRPARIKASFGLSGTWMLCWLDDEGASRLALLEALLVTSPDAGGGSSSGCFVPVFRRGVKEAMVRTAVRGLGDQYRQHIRTPWYQDPVTGELSPPAASGEAPWAT